VEYQSTILPGKKLKFDAQAIYSEEASVLQGFVGTTANDEINALLVLPDGRVVATGMLGDPVKGLPQVARRNVPGLSPGGTAFVAVFDARMRAMEWMASLGGEVGRGRKLALGADGAVFLGADKSGASGMVVMKFAPGLERLIWRMDPPGDRITGLGVLADQSCVVSAERTPFVYRVKADGSGLVPFGSAEALRIDLANADLAKRYWEELGYAEEGVRMQAALRGGVGGVVTTADDGIVFFASHSIRLGGKEFGGAPDFDLMLARFDTSGRVVWASNLAAGIPNPSDHKLPRIAYDPHSGDILVSATQHGHFSREQNLVLTEEAYLDVDRYFTGDIMIGWLARVDAATGKVKASTYFFPDLQKPPEAGKRFASSLFPEALAADREGRVYLTGVTGYKLATTLHAFQTDPMGSPGFLAVFDRDLGRLLHCSLITGRGYGVRGMALALASLGPVVASAVSPGDPPVEAVVANAAKTNYLGPKPFGMQDAMLTLYPSATWWE